MNYSRIKFQPQGKDAFFPELRKRVEAYFTENNLSKSGDNRLIVKALLMIGLYIVPFGLILWGGLPLSAQWFLALIMGIGTAGVGMGVMHDANHGSFSSKPWVNKLFGMSIYLLGGNAYNWKVQHNQLHHTYTNVHEIDEDITGKLVIRLSYQDRLFGFQRFQHIYAFPLYSLMTISFLVKDFKEIYLYNKLSKTGLVKAFTAKELSILLASKVGYFLFILGLPMWLTDLTLGQWFIGFMTLHCSAGLILSVIFQMAHVVEGAAQPAPDQQGNLENAWAIHQLLTTANFAGGSKLLSWYIGGLDYQVEHHLFPAISHIHYPAIAPIVQQTAEEFGLPYNNKQTLWNALASHARMLRDMGRYEKQPQTAVLA